MNNEPNDPYGELGGGSDKSEAAREKIHRDLEALKANRPAREAAAARLSLEEEQRQINERLAQARRDIEDSSLRVDAKSATEKISEMRAINQERERQGLPLLEFEEKDFLKPPKGFS